MLLPLCEVLLRLLEERVRLRELTGFLVVLREEELDDFDEAVDFFERDVELVFFVVGFFVAGFFAAAFLRVLVPLLVALTLRLVEVLVFFEELDDFAMLFMTPFARALPRQTGND